VSVTPSDPAGPNRLDHRLIERCEEIPHHPEPGDYVVIDTFYFSNTVVELLHNGAECVHVTDERGEEFAYREEHPRALLGGGATDAYEPVDGYDFFNSPSDVQRLDVAGRPVSMTSSNGGRAVATLRDRGDEGVSVFVGSTTNAAALAEHLRERERDTYLVSAGTLGEVAAEDHIGAVLISRHLDGLPLAAAERTLFRRQLANAKGVGDGRTHRLRRRDVTQYAMNLNGRRVVPELVGDTLVDVSARRGRHAALSQTVDRPAASPDRNFSSPN